MIYRAPYVVVYHTCGLSLPKINYFVVKRFISMIDHH